MLLGFESLLRSTIGLERKSHLRLDCDSKLILYNIFFQVSGSKPSKNHFEAKILLIKEQDSDHFVL
jgi:hypothetical protein